MQSHWLGANLESALAKVWGFHLKVVLLLAEKSAGHATASNYDLLLDNDAILSLISVSVLLQVASFGCQSFALLFDDIEVEMCEADKEIFQSFAAAQVSVTNEVYQHLSQPRFLFCPTEYCATRAVPTVSNSEYLNTIGSKLLPNIDILWTGEWLILFHCCHLVNFNSCSVQARWGLCRIGPLFSKRPPNFITTGLLSPLLQYLAAFHFWQKTPPPPFC